MQRRHKKEGITVLEAVDNLTHMVEIDKNAPAPQLDGSELTEEQVSEQLAALSWHSPEYVIYNRDRIKETFSAILRYLKHLHEHDKGRLRDPDTQRGLQAIMLLAAEAAKKVDTHTQLYKEMAEGSITDVREYQDLIHFYQNKVFQKYQMPAEGAIPWQEEWGEMAESDLIDQERQGLKDLETLRRDREYELLLIRKEDGRTFFDKDLLRHLRLVGEFDDVLGDIAGEDPFVRVKMIQDRDLNHSASQILRLVAPYVDDYFKEALKFKEIEFVGCINKALMALLLAANTRNLMQNAIGKSSLSYFADFHFYLRKALMSQEYQRYVAHTPENNERFFHLLINISHALCTAFFMRIGGRDEMLHFIRHLNEAGGKNAVKQSPVKSPLAMWNCLIDEDLNIRYLLKHYPNGPLLRAIDTFRSDTQLLGFDPMAQENLPSQWYTVVNDEMHISCLKIPSPIHQENIQKAEVVDEFIGFLRSLGSERKNQRHLLFNLQDRTSWQEHARCSVLEEVQKKAEHLNTLVVVTIPKNGDFYLQSGTYINLNQAPEFIAQFKDQIASREQCGFYFPANWKEKPFLVFAESAMKAIHTLFFGGKELLVHKNRLDFIEIFYLLMTLKVIEFYQPDSISFTCKDGIDTGAAMAAELYAFLRIMNDQSAWTDEERGFIKWMLYSGALTLRERAIDPSRFNRLVSAMEVVQAELEAKPKEVISSLKQLFSMGFFSQTILHSA